MMQVFGSHLQLTPHVQLLAAEAVWDPENQQMVVPAPDDGAVEAVLRRVLRQLARRWPPGAPPWAEDEDQPLQEEAVRARLRLHVESRPHPRRRLVAVLEGFCWMSERGSTETTVMDWSAWTATAPAALSPSRG